MKGFNYTNNKCQDLDFTYLKTFKILFIYFIAKLG